MTRSAEVGENLVSRAAVATEPRVSHSLTSRHSHRLVAAMVFVGSFIFRFLDPDFTNDHFFWISGGRQIAIYGELPVRDFWDPGYFLQHFASAAMQLIFGYNLLGEFLLSATLISLGYMFTCLLATRASNSLTIGLAVTVLAMITYPRLYNYHKVFLPVFGLFLCWRYLDSKRPSRLVLLALYTALAALFRHDYGLYIGSTGLITVIAAHTQDGYPVVLHRLALYGCIAAAPVLLFLVFVQANAGILAYRGVSGDYTARQAQISVKGVPPAFVLDLTAPLLIRDPPPPPAPTGPEPFFRAWQRAIPLRFTIAPGLFHAANAAPWCYYLFVTLPLVAIAILALNRLGPRFLSQQEPLEAPKMLVCATLCVVATPLLLRSPLEARFADVAAPAAVLGAWLLGRWLGELGSVAASARLRVLRRQPSLPNVVGVVRFAAPRVGRLLVALALLAVTWRSIITIGEIRQWSSWRLVRTGPAALVTHMADRFEELRASPPRKLWPSSDNVELKALAEYVYECSRPTDKTLVLTSFAPEFYFYSGRGRPNRNKLGSEPMPIIVWDATRYDASRVADYVRERYEAARASNFGSDGRWQVLVDKQLTPFGTYHPLSLPCYAPST